MPPSPRDRPALDRALPGDLTDNGTYRQAETGDGRMVLFGDGSWRWVSIRAWMRDRHGRVVFYGEWHAGGISYGDWYVASEEKMREP